MSEPLIDLNTVAVIIWQYLPQNSTTNLMHVSDCDDAANAVLAYLRSVLTPEVLIVNDLYLRVFGEDK